LGDGGSRRITRSIGTSASPQTTVVGRTHHSGPTTIRDRKRYGSPVRRRWAFPVLAAAMSVLAAGCSSSPSAPGPAAVTASASSQANPALPLRRGYLEIGTYETEIFRPAFTIDIPVSSQWGTFGETGRRVQIGGRGGFFSFLALSAQGSSPNKPALMEALRAGSGLHVESVGQRSFAGLPAARVAVVAGGGHARITFGGQRLSFFPAEHATLWLLAVGSAPVLVVLGTDAVGSRPFQREAMRALRSVRFQAGP